MDAEHKSVGLLTLTPRQSKKLIAEAVAIHPAVRRALEEGTIVITLGTTNAHVAARLLGKEVDESRYAAGIVRGGELDVVPAEERLPGVILRRGKPCADDQGKVLAEFTGRDVLIKGGNAVDAEGVVGVLMANREGGTIGKALGIVKARGATLLMPVGLEKLIPSVAEASSYLGLDRVGFATGEKAGLMPVVGAELITELQALQLLAGIKAVMVASGGWGDSQGSVTLAVTGQQPQVEKALQWALYVKGRRADRPV
jgi:hypothetical protein